MPELIKSTYPIGTEYLVQETQENPIGLKPFNPIAIPVSQNLLFKAILVVSSNVDPSYTNIEGGISGTISTLNIDPTLGNGFNLFTGDKVLLKTTIEDIYELTLTANFVYGVNTSISFVPFISYSTIENGSIILASQSDQFNEGNRKTRGQVAGFTISPSTITKNGIGISSWYNDPTFNIVDNTTLPTSQAVKEYVLSKKNIIEDKLIKVNNDVINKSAFLHDDGLRFTRVSDGAETGQINYDGVDTITLNSNGGSSTGATRLDFQVNSGSKMVIDNEGKVGIGTTAPVNKLEIQNTTSVAGGISKGEYPLQLTNTGVGNTGVTGIAFSSQSDDTDIKSAIVFKGSTNGYNRGDIQFLMNSASDNTNVAVDTSAVLTIKDSGKVGIGTTSPVEKLDVKDGFIQVSGTGPSGYGYLLNRAGQDIYSIRHLDSGLTISNETDSRKEMTFNGTGNVGIGMTAPKNKLDLAGSLGRGIPVTKTANFGVAATENWLIVNGLATITITLPTASSWTGRELMIKNIAAFTVVSASSNVKPIDTDTAATAILPAIAGSWCTLVSNGSDWVTMMNG
jgi:hypothetical protein